MKPKPKTNICVIYYNKLDDSFVKITPIENGTFTKFSNIYFMSYSKINKFF